LAQRVVFQVPIRFRDEELYRHVAESARREDRSLNNEVIHRLRKSVEDEQRAA
jgi:hypothetical protein